MLLDPRTILFGLAVFTIMVGTVFTTLGIRRRYDVVALAIGVGGIVTGLGETLLILRDVIPVVLSALFGNLLTLAGCSILLFGVARMSDRRFAPLLHLAIALAWLGGGGWFLLVEPDINARVVIASLLLLMVALELVRLLPGALRGIPATLRTVLFICVGIFAASALIRVIDAGVGLGVEHMFQPTVVNVLTLGGFFVSTCGIITGLMTVVVMRGDSAWQNRFDQAENLARHDALTGALNRRGLEMCAEEFFARSERAGQDACVIVFDIDHFKLINDRHGHAFGDRVLTRVAETVAGQLRIDDIFGRLGGEEFAILLAGTDAEGAYAMAERLRLAMGAVQEETPDGPIGVTGSFGVAARQPGETLGDLLGRADGGMYRAKAAGRDQVVLV